MDNLKYVLIALFAAGAAPLLSLGMGNTAMFPMTFLLLSFWGGFLYMLWRL